MFEKKWWHLNSTISTLWRTTMQKTRSNAKVIKILKKHFDTFIFEFSLKAYSWCSFIIVKFTFNVQFHRTSSFNYPNVPLLLCEVETVFGLSDILSVQNLSYRDVQNTSIPLLPHHILFQLHYQVRSCIT